MLSPLILLWTWGFGAQALSLQVCLLTLRELTKQVNYIYAATFSFKQLYESMVSSPFKQAEALINMEIGSDVFGIYCLFACY